MDVQVNKHLVGSSTTATATNHRSPKAMNLSRRWGSISFWGTPVKGFIYLRARERYTTATHLGFHACICCKRNPDSCSTRISVTRNKISNTCLITPSKCTMFVHYIYLLYFSYMVRCLHHHQREIVCPLLKPPADTQLMSAVTTAVASRNIKGKTLLLLNLQ